MCATSCVVLPAGRRSNTDRLCGRDVPAACMLRNAVSVAAELSSSGIRRRPFVCSCSRVQGCPASDRLAGDMDWWYHRHVPAHGHMGI